MTEERAGGIVGADGAPIANDGPEPGTVLIDEEGELEAVAPEPFLVVPRESFVLLRQEKAERPGLALPEASKQVIWTVVAVGPGRVTQTGQRVLIQLKAGQRVVIDPTAEVIGTKDGSVQYGLVCEEFIAASYTGMPSF